MKTNKKRINRVARRLGLAIRKPKNRRETDTPYVVSPLGENVVLAEAGDLEGVFKAIYVLGQDRIVEILGDLSMHDGGDWVLGTHTCADRHQFAADLARLSSTYLSQNNDLSPILMN